MYIGENKFFLYKHLALDDGKSRLSFYIPSEDFHKLNDGAKMYLSFGNVFSNETESEKDEIVKNNPRCWALGKLSKKHLVKL